MFTGILDLTLLLWNVYREETYLQKHYRLNSYFEMFTLRGADVPAERLTSFILKCWQEEELTYMQKADMLNLLMNAVTDKVRRGGAWGDHVKKKTKCQRQKYKMSQRARRMPAHFININQHFFFIIPDYLLLNIYFDVSVGVRRRGEHESSSLRAGGGSSNSEESQQRSLRVHQPAAHQTHINTHRLTHWYTHPRKHVQVKTVCNDFVFIK